MIHTEGCPADLHGWLSHRFHGGDPQISQVHADEILSFHTEVTDILLELHVYKHEQQAQSVGYRTDL